MDEGPFRMPRPTEKKPENNSNQQNQFEDASIQGRKEEIKPVHRTETQMHRIKHEKKSLKRFLMPAGMAVAVIVVIVFGWVLLSGMKSGETGIDSSKYQAVFFTNNQVYFGKLSKLNDSYMKLTDIFYLQTQQTDQDSKNLQKAGGAQDTNVQLTKLGNELHGPQDEMIIAKDQMLFFENLKDDGQVSQKIKEFNSQSQE